MEEEEEEEGLSKLKDLSYISFTPETLTPLPPPFKFSYKTER